MITFKLPQTMSANDWLFTCLRDGDYNGVLEWVAKHDPSVDKVELGYADPALKHRCPSCRAEPGEDCHFRPSSQIPNGEGRKHLTRGMVAS
ncbi:hypothetical protein [Mycobacteroides franklinii]|uniref:zinc finger domain-containing protein n=1 Tax=Mycobacteroides franklinii TaxID=948102 RepID=UPI003AF598D4